MKYRRIVPLVSALALAVPSAGVAKASHGPIPHPVQPVAYGGASVGDTKYDLHVQTYEQAIGGNTHGNLPRAVVAGPAVKPANTPTTTAAPVVAGDDSTDGWQIAALGEAALLALAFGGGAFVATRSRRTASLGA
jgi:hypothetical protein